MDHGSRLADIQQHHKRTHDQMATARSDRGRPWSLSSGDDNSDQVSHVRDSSLRVVPSNRQSRPLAIQPPESNTTLTARPPLPRSAHIIDLTADDNESARQHPGPARTRQEHPIQARPRPQSAQEQVIDVDALPDSRLYRNHPARSASPEIELIFARQTNRPQRQAPAQPVHVEPRQGVFGLNAGAAGPFGHLNLPVPGVVPRIYGGQGFWRNDAAPHMAPRVNRIGQQRQRRHASAERRLELHEQMLFHVPRLRAAIGALGGDPNEQMLDIARFVAPDMLPYDAVALDGDDTNDEPVPPPTYDTPSEPRNGFTRSPVEKDTILCPNCGDELGIGDSSEKRSVWFVRGCGHVFCGECTAHKAKKESKKETRKWKGKPFSHCPVCDLEGVKTPVTHPSKMRQIFL